MQRRIEMKSISRACARGCLRILNSQRSMAFFRGFHGYTTRLYL